VDIDLGQHELVEEDLGVDARVCVAQYVASVYTTTPLRDRADAVLQAIEGAEGVATLSSPIQELEDASGGRQPELEAFLQLRVKRLARVRAPKNDWESGRERWLREAVFRLDGIPGLERLARETRRPRACLAWYTALAERGESSAALQAAVVSAGLVRQPQWRGELLDGPRSRLRNSSGRIAQAVGERVEGGAHAGPLATVAGGWRPPRGSDARTGSEGDGNRDRSPRANAAISS
jgi:hypothetical protein